jgi:hypothetical protein
MPTCSGGAFKGGDHTMLPAIVIVTAAHTGDDGNGPYASRRRLDFLTGFGGRRGAARRDTGTTALADFDETCRGQFADRTVQRSNADAELLREFSERRQSHAGRECIVGDHCGNAVTHLSL